MKGGTILKDLQYIKDKLSLLPVSPGCYLMKNKEQEIIYVGKAKKLKSRVSSYFNGAHDYKTTKLVEEIVDFDYIVTNTEKEALLLEINLIKDYTPKYNIMFMDNSYYPYIQLTKEKHPRLQIVRDAKNKKNKHFGPFPDATAAREIFKLLNKLYPLRKCNTIPKKPCLYASLNQCLAPCMNEISKEEYDKISKDISKFIQGDIKNMTKDLEDKMLLASENQEYEKAKEFRDLLQHIHHVTSKQHVQFSDYINRDILGYHVDKGYLSLQLFFMREGKLLSRDINLLPIYGEVEEEVTRFILQFYEQNTLPKELLLPNHLDIDLLNSVLDCKVRSPLRGKKLDLVKMANQNAKEALDNKFLLMEKQDKATIGAMQELGEVLKIKTPHIIELFDNSNIQGSYAVAGMVCFVDGIPSKQDYRRFKIKTVEGPDDYASMKEIIYRRYLRVLMKEIRSPDLIIVDGGKGQINAAKEILDRLELQIPVCGLGKDDKHQTAVLLNWDGEVQEINRKSDLFYLLTRMQDEVHRYAISYHRLVRSKSLFDSILDKVPGIGEKRKKKLLRRFGSTKKMKEATIEELQEILPLKVAEDLRKVLYED